MEKKEKKQGEKGMEEENGKKREAEDVRGRESEGKWEGE
jgi:hypothetical protein